MSTAVKTKGKKAATKKAAAKKVKAAEEKTLVVVESPAKAKTIEARTT